MPEAILPLVEVVLSVFPVAWVFGRAGCAVVHDHPGTKAAANAWFAIAYGPGPIERFGLIELRHGSSPQYDLGLLEMLYAMILALAFAWTWRRARKRGWYIVASCISYAPVRFALDFLRLDDNAGGDLRYGALTPAQWACCAMFLFGLGLATWLRRHPPIAESRTASLPIGSAPVQYGKTE
jgi:phosphatidylglycerol:prolipoprotein diacylglycerol transferase